jgi:Tfp pilus assembly protein PilN
MAQSINLIPQDEVQEQQKVKLVKASTIFMVVVLIIVVIASAFYFFQATSLRRGIKNYDTSIAGLRTDIQALSDIEITARNLDARYQALTSIYNERLYFSKLLDELQNRVPESIIIDNLNIATENRINITGTGDNYLSIAEFLRQLAEAEEFVTNVTLNSVTLEAAKGRVSFFIIVNYDPKFLN